MNDSPPEIRKARAVSGFVDSLRLRNQRLCGVVRFESPNGKPLAVALVPVVCHGERWLLLRPDGRAEPRPQAADIRPSQGRLGHVDGDTVGIEVPWPPGDPAEALLLLLHAQIEDIGDPEFGLAHLPDPPIDESPDHAPPVPHMAYGIKGSVSPPGSGGASPADDGPLTATGMALRAAIARCLMRRPASELDLAVLRRPARPAPPLVGREVAEGRKETGELAELGKPGGHKQYKEDQGHPEREHAQAPATRLGLEPRPRSPSPAFALGSCQYPAGILDGSVNLRHAVRVDADIGPADRALWRLAARCEADASIDALILTGDLVYVDATAGLFDPKAQNDALEFAYARLRDNHALDRIKRLGVSIFTLMDDHEIRDDYGGEAGEIDDARRHFVSAQRVMWPPPAYRAGSPLWAARQVAGHPCFLADTRSEREPRTLANWREATLCSAAQMDALLQWIARQSRHVGPAFVVTPSMLLPRPLGLSDSGPAAALHVDAWCGYPASLHRLLAWVHDRRARNLVFLSGDEHLSSLVRITLHDGDRSNEPVVVHSIHSSALYAPFPFANSRAEEFAAPDCFEFEVDGRRGRRTLVCEVEVLDWIPGDGHALIRPVGDGEDWKIHVDFDRTDARAGRQHVFALSGIKHGQDGKRALNPAWTPSA